MYHRHPHENRYCFQCIKTTSHSVEKDQMRELSKFFKCQRCGAEQRCPCRRVPPKQETPLATMTCQSW
jgi:hypothetical protein